MTTSSPLSSQPAANASNTEVPRVKITVPEIARMRAEHRRISMITAYDVTFARLVDRGGVDIILVGDSVGMVLQGEDNTIPVDLDEMEYHVRLVARARTRAMVVGDLPFGSYQVSPQQAVASSVRLMKAGAQGVKLEGGVSMAETIAAIARVDIPVMGHIGLTPQSYHRMGGHKVQGRQSGFDAGNRERLIEDAHAVEQAGAFSIVLEGIPLDLAAEITHKVSIPTIGIGAGADCDGQVLVLHDVLGLSDHTFKFAKSYADLRGAVVTATQAFVAEVRDGTWPDDMHSFH